MGIKDRIFILIKRCLNAYEVLVGKVELGHINMIKEGCNPFPKGPSMDQDSQIRRWNHLYKDLGIVIRNRFNFTFKNRAFDIRSPLIADNRCRYIMVPHKLTVERLIKIIKEKYVDFEIVTQSLGSLCGLQDVRSNEDDYYLVKMNEPKTNPYSKFSSELSENTVLERLLYYIMLYRESGSFDKFDQTIICKGTGDSRSVIEMKTEREEIDGKTLIMIKFSKTNRLS